MFLEENYVLKANFQIVQMCAHIFTQIFCFVFLFFLDLILAEGKSRELKVFCVMEKSEVMNLAKKKSFLIPAKAQRFTLGGVVPGTSGTLRQSAPATVGT